jgi:multidrug efflux system membrane fusion protein
MGTDQAQIDAAKLNIAYCHIVAPVGGRVGLRLVDAGNYVQPTDATGLVVITEIEPISVIFSTPEDNLQRITRRLKDDGKLPVAVYDRANVTKIGDGELTTYDNEIDTTTGTFKLRAMFENKDDALFPNQFVNVRLLVDTLKNVVVVPNAAVQVGAAGPFVYLVQDDGTVAVRKVTQGPNDATLTVIESGVRAGDKVVIDGVDRLRDGAKVRVIAAESQSDAAAPGAGKAGGGGGAGGQHHRHRDGDAAGAPTASPSAAP